MSNMQSYSSRESGAKSAQLNYGAGLAAAGAGAGGAGQRALSPAPFGVCPGTAGSQQRFSQMNQSRSVTPNQMQQSSTSSSASGYLNFYQSASVHSPPAAPPRPVMQGAVGAGAGAINGLQSSAPFQGPINRHMPPSNYFGHGGIGAPTANRNLPAPCYPPPASGREGAGYHQMKHLETAGNSYAGGQSSSGMSRFNSATNYPQNSQLLKRMYGNGGPSNALNLSESDFPCLSMGGHHHHQGQQMGYRGGYNASNRPYAFMGAAKSASGVSAKPEFQIENEDFPALPGSEEPKETAVVTTTASATGATTASVDSAAVGAKATASGRPKNAAAPAEKPGIVVSADGMVSNVPPTMLKDHFGMAGMVVFLKSAHKDQAMISLLLGHDLMHLGVNLNSSDKYLHPSFGGPWRDGPLMGTEIAWKLPPEYLACMPTDGDPKSSLKMNRFSEDLLFWLFYYCVGETYQLVAAAELYLRDWRYHKQEKVWLTRAPGTQPTEKTATHERGMYHIFDPAAWRKIGKEMLLEYAKLEDQVSTVYSGNVYADEAQQMDA